ncbi:hypothetical protein ACO0LC_12365 [Undibacterium sp. JH2W]|uniref:hypothetical protein n=1 Tax=Undibacterium sp. JH2W TaxID=3413037 RepID=UPI003BEF8F6B
MSDFADMSDKNVETLWWSSIFGHGDGSFSGRSRDNIFYSYALLYFYIHFKLHAAEKIPR